MELTVDSFTAVDTTGFALFEGFRAFLSQLLFVTFTAVIGLGSEHGAISVPEPGVCGDDQVRRNNVVNQNEDLGGESTDVLAEEEPVEVALEVLPDAHDANDDAERPDHNPHNAKPFVGLLVSELSLSAINLIIRFVVISVFIGLIGFVGLQVRYIFTVPAGWVVSVRVLSSFDNVFELTYIFRSLVTSDGSLDHELFNPWDSLTVIVLEKAFSDHSVARIAVGGHLQNDFNPGEGSVLPCLVEIFTVAVRGESEGEHAAETVSISLAHVEERVRANEEASDELEPAVGVVGEG